MGICVSNIAGQPEADENATFYKSNANQLCAVSKSFTSSCGTVIPPKTLGRIVDCKIYLTAYKMSVQPNNVSDVITCDGRSVAAAKRKYFKDYFDNLWPDDYPTLQSKDLQLIDNMQSTQVEKIKSRIHNLNIENNNNAGVNLSNLTNVTNVNNVIVNLNQSNNAASIQST